MTETVASAFSAHTVEQVPIPAWPSDSTNIALLLWGTATEHGSTCAISERDVDTTYSELRSRAAEVAARLTADGVKPGDRVAVFLERGADAAAAFFGAVACGAIAINVNETLRPRQVEHILSHSSAAALISSAEMLARQPRPIESPARRYDMATMSGGDDSFAPVRRVGNDLAQIIYTSGSTGLPKGVTLMHSNLWSGVRAVSSYVRISSHDRIASLLPFSFDYGFNQLLCAVGAGATLVVERSPLPQQIVATLRAKEITVLPCVPPLWLQLVGTSTFRSACIPSLRAMTNTGGRVPVDAVRQLRAANPQAQLFLMYGLTEAFRATYLPPELVDAHPDSIGRAIPGTEIMVVREDLTPCEPGEVGELVQRGSTVAAGYWNDPETTALRFRPNPLRPKGSPDSERVVFSGDLVRRDANGLLYYVGRKDGLIKSLGYRISPDEIADVIYASGQVVEAVVGTVPDKVRGDSIVAYVVLREDGTAEAVHRFCRAELPTYLQPGKIEVRSELPRTSSGKFDVRAAQAAGDVQHASV
ncbi:MAG TPA: AMP-binding protein [Gemmatimonadaceae bacterium]|jgi:amino acid adenylation domain-containing protein|nr:AMP-binding protein [Gemmatimonadaceae bacterium]